MKTLIFNPFVVNSNECKTQWFHEEDCPVIIKDKTVTFNPKKMLVDFPYRFEYCEEILVAIKKNDKVIDIYEEVT